MSGSLTFPWSQVRTLVDSAVATPERHPTFGQLQDPAFRFDRSPPAPGSVPMHTDVDPALLPPGLIVVGGIGVYLKSNARLPAAALPPAVYAREADPAILSKADCICATVSIWGAQEGTEFLAADLFASYDEFFSTHKVAESDRGVRIEMESDSLTVLPCKLQAKQTG